MRRFIFACVHNAGRSQMAAAWFNALADPASAVAFSAGTAPADRIHPEVAAAMEDVGVSLADARPTLLTSALANEADLLVTMGCGETCPVLPSVRVIDWPLADPKGQPVDVVRGIRDDIRSRVERLIEEEGVRPRRSST